MDDIFLKGFFHPVGQGAFFTEHFFDPYNNKRLFNVVYDCGSFSGGKYYASSILKKEINKTFNKTDHIDFLFISHFDGEHINGLDYLLEIIGIMQIPHHGSLNCYPDNFINDTKDCSAFVNYEPDYSQLIFCPVIIQYFSHQKHCI